MKIVNQKKRRVVVWEFPDYSKLIYRLLATTTMMMITTTAAPPIKSSVVVSIGNPPPPPEVVVVGPVGVVDGSGIAGKVEIPKSIPLRTRL